MLRRLCGGPACNRGSRPLQDPEGVSHADVIYNASQAVAALQTRKKVDLINSLKKLRMLIKGGVSACERTDEGQTAAKHLEAHRAALAEAWAGAFRNLWPVFEQAMKQHGSDEDVMEELMRTTKNAVQVRACAACLLPVCVCLSVGACALLHAFMLVLIYGYWICMERTVLMRKRVVFVCVCISGCLSVPVSMSVCLCVCARACLRGKTVIWRGEDEDV